MDEDELDDFINEALQINDDERLDQLFVGEYHRQINRLIKKID